VYGAVHSLGMLMVDKLAEKGSIGVGVCAAHVIRGKVVINGGEVDVR
jgi:hypothetical protein